MKPDNHILLYYDTGYCEATLNPEMAENLRTVFELEVEMLKGTKTPLEDGRTKYCFVAEDRMKRAMIAKLMAHAQILSNIETRLN